VCMHGNYCVFTVHVRSVTLCFKCTVDVVKLSRCASFNADN